LATGVLRPLMPDLIREYPRRVADVFGETWRPAEGRQLMRERLAFLAACRIVSRALATERGRRRLRPRVEVDGLEHLTAAMADARGAILVSTHFGLPYLMRIVLDDLGIRHLHAKREEGRANVSVSGDAWARLAALRRFQAGLGDGAACVLLADGRMGTPTEIPFFHGATPATLGAFSLGYVARRPILPYFGLMPDSRSRLRVEIGPPLRPATAPGRAGLAAVAEEFFSLYRSYARRYPSHLPKRLVRRRETRP
jgi:lauroyl/myristoyl acyltransferase